jgi:opacity protein-like surface antigen
MLKMTKFAFLSQMTMKKILFTLAILITMSGLFAQRHHEFGLFGGVSYYMGELNPSGQFLNPHAAYGLVYRYNINPHWAFKLNAITGTVSGSDATNPDESRRSNNLSFKSPITEISGQAELNFFKYIVGSDKHRFSPYIFGGFSIFRFNPMAEFMGNWYELQPLGTEGQGTTAYPDRKPYSLTSVAFPFGLGLKLSLSDNFALSLEWGLRKAVTDYIDDVSSTYADPYILAAESGGITMVLANRNFELAGATDYGGGPLYSSYPKEIAAAQWSGKQRGNPENKDWYSFSGLTLTFKIRPPKSKICPAYDTYYKYREYYMF